MSAAVVLKKFARNKGAVVGAVLVLILVLVAIAAPVLAPYDPLRMNPRHALQPPSWEFVMGTDQYGRDVFSRVLHGSRISLTLGVIAVGIATLIGCPLGLLAGFYPGRVDTIISRVMDVLLAFPSYFLAMAVVATLGFGLENVMIAVGIAAVPEYARIVRSSVITTRELAFVEAARGLGARDHVLLIKHIVPNVLAPVIVLATLGVATAILIGSALSFLGLGAAPPTPEWGAMVGWGRQYLRVAWWMSTFPGLAIMVTVLSVNLVGDALRDALDPRIR